jgi:hypothetical protein
MEANKFERSIEIKAKEASAITEKVGTWWKEVSKESGTAASVGKLYAIGNYLITLVKNSLGDGKSDGKVSAVFDEEKITLEVEDFGSEDKQQVMNIGGDYGFKEIVEYADAFEIEANGTFYEKNKWGKMDQTDESDLRVGSKVTFVKYIGVPPVEEEEETYHTKRNFAERM